MALMNEQAEKIFELRKQGHTWNEISAITGFSAKGLSSWFAKNKDKYTDSGVFEDVTTGEYKKQTKQNDGSIVSQLRVKRQINEEISEDELLKLHGFSPVDFKIKSIISNEWNYNGKDSNFQTKIVVQPKAEEISIDDLVKAVHKKVSPTYVDYERDTENEALLIPLADIHMGLNNITEYKHLLGDIVSVIREKQREQTIISVLGDFFHVDNFLGTTEKGTYVGKVDFESGVEQATLFLTMIINTALENSKKVILNYLPGNHAPSVDYMLIKIIELRFPQVQFDISIDEFKSVKFHSNLLMFHHGDKVKQINKMRNVAVSKFGKDWHCDSRYLFTGHFHHEKSLSEGGMTWYQLQSPSKHSDYEKEYGFDTSESGLMLFEFNEQKRTKIIYLNGQG